MLSIILNRENVSENKVPIRMTTIKNKPTAQNNVWWGCGEVEAYSLLVGVHHSAAPPQIQQLHFWTDTSQSWNQRLDETLAYLCSYNSTAHSSLNMQETQVSTVGWMDMQNVAYPYGRRPLGLKREGNPDTCCNTDEPWRDNAQWNKSVTHTQKNKYRMIPLIRGP